MRIVPKEIETFWTLFTAPVIWAVHFLFCYVGAAVFCAKQAELDLSFEIIRIAIAGGTLVALALITLSGFLAWRQWGFGLDAPPHDDPTAHDRRHFQGFSTLLLSCLSFVAVIFVALPALFIAECVR